MDASACTSIIAPGMTQYGENDATFGGNMTHTIVLVHGLLGFGTPHILGIPLPSPFDMHYFNGVAAHFTGQGIDVEEPQLSPIGTIAVRAAQLRDMIVDAAPGRVDIIAHSMGGLDARFAISHYPEVARRVTTLTTIGTPHHGSPVADAVVGQGPSLSDAIPPWLEGQIGALNHLTVAASEAFNASAQDVPGIHYFNIAGDARAAGSEFLLFELAERIGDITNEINDGVVTRSSALFKTHEHLPDWPVDHAGEVGWAKPAGFSLLARDYQPQGHVQRYSDLLAKIMTHPER